MFTLLAGGMRNNAINVSIFVCWYIGLYYLSACLSVRSYISKLTCPNVTKFSVHVNCCHVSILLRRQCDFRFSIWRHVFTQWRQWSRVKDYYMFCQVCQVDAPGRSLMPTIACYHLRSTLINNRWLQHNNRQSWLAELRS